jgi:hypothetical protein
MDYEELCCILREAEILRDQHSGIHCMAEHLAVIRYTKEVVDLGGFGDDYDWVQDVLEAIKAMRVIVAKRPLGT